MQPPALWLDGAEPKANSLCRAAFRFCLARTSARLPGQAPVTALASPVSQEREGWLQPGRGRHRAVETLSQTLRGGHLHVPGADRDTPGLCQSSGWPSQPKGPT